jgi:hypothetical protein
MTQQIKVIQHINPTACDIDIESLKWSQSKTSPSVWYGNFRTLRDKYLHVELDVQHGYGDKPACITVKCSPVIWSKSSDGMLALAESDWAEYIKHPDYWYAEIEYLIPSADVQLQAYTITALKWQYEIWAIATTAEEINELYEISDDVEVELIEVTRVTDVVVK